jgi:AraC family transcriptional regulator
MASSAETTLNQSAALARPGRPIAEYNPPPDLESRSLVDISPSEIVRRHSTAWSGLHVETVQVMRHKPFEYGFRAPCHLLIAAQFGERYDGETFVEGLPRSTLRDCTQKLIFVPAGHDFRGWQRPRVLTRVTHFYIDPRGPLADPALRFGEIEFKPRLFFYDRDLWETALKLKAQVENPGSMHRQYAEALGIVLMYELVRINGDAGLRGPVVAALRLGSKSGWRRISRSVSPTTSGSRPSPSWRGSVPTISPGRSSILSACRRTDIMRIAESNGPSSYWRIVSSPSPRLRSMSASARRARSPPHFHKLTGQAPSRYRRNLD